jgi:hypothetical protein
VYYHDHGELCLYRGIGATRGFAGE